MSNEPKTESMGEGESLARIFYWSTLGGAVVWVALVLLFVL